MVYYALHGVGMLMIAITLCAQTERMLLTAFPASWCNTLSLSAQPVKGPLFGCKPD
jgi:hypothetical protein